MASRVPRRRVLALAFGALAGCLSNPRERRDPTDTEGDPDPQSITTATRQGETGCGAPVGPEWGSRETDPSVPPCPENGGELEACSARTVALGLEKRRRYALAIERHDGGLMVTFEVYAATVTATDSGFIVSARLYFTATTGDGSTTETSTGTTEGKNRTETGDAGTRTVTATDATDGPTGFYDASYLVTPDAQWRATGRFQTEGTLREAGSEVTCVDGA